jgi:hypothetical protein
MTPSPFISKLKTFLPIAEITCIAGFAVGFMLTKQDNPLGREIVMLSLGGLSVIYFLTAYLPPDARPSEESEQKAGFLTLLGRTIAPKLLAVGSSVMVIGILFAVQQMKGSEQMLLVASATLAGASLVGFVSISKDETARKILGPLLLRSVPLLFIGIYLLSQAPTAG